MVATYQNITSDLFTKSFPQKHIVCYSDDRPWYNDQLRKLKRQRLREYAKNGKSPRYIELYESYSVKSKEAIEKYKEKMKSEVLEGKRGSFYPIIKKLGSQPYESERSFRIPSHATHNFSHQQSAEALADHFSRISQQLPPLNIESLSSEIRSALESSDLSTAPVLNSIQVRKRLIKAKMPPGQNQ